MVNEQARQESPATDPTGRNPVTAARVEEILTIISKETGLAGPLLALDATFETLGIPSLDVVQTIFELEAHFDIEIPVVSTDKGSEFNTIRDLVDHVLMTIANARGEAINRPGTTA
jgi:acyl carrier protein